MDKNLMREELKALGVHDLRNIARDVGVVGPTMKVKEQLVEEIVKIRSGEMEARTGALRGRKPKAKVLGGAISILPPELTAIIQAKEQKKHLILGGNLGYLTLCQDSSSELVPLVEKQGFLLCENDVFYFFDDSSEKSMVYVPTQVCENLDLKIGDKILVNCKKMPGNNIYLAKNIISINNCKAKKYKREFCQFDDFAVSSTKWFCNEITEGELKIISSTSIKDFLKEKNQLFEFCNQNNIFVSFLGRDVPVAEQEELEKMIKFGEIGYVCSDNVESSFEKLITLINNAIVRAQSGQKVLAVLCEFDNIFKSFETLTKLTNMSENDFKALANKIQGLSRILKNNGSLTTLIVKF